MRSAIASTSSVTSGTSITASDPMPDSSINERTSLMAGSSGSSSHATLELFEIAEAVQQSALDLQRLWEAKVGVLRPPPAALRAAPITFINFRAGCTLLGIV